MGAGILRGVGSEVDWRAVLIMMPAERSGFMPESTVRADGGAARGRGMIICAAIAAVAFRSNAGPTSNVWNGGSGDWNNAANWSTGVVPNAPDADVLID